MSYNSYFNQQNKSVPAKFRKFKSEYVKYKPMNLSAAPRNRFVQRVLVTMPRLKPPPFSEDASRLSSPNSDYPPPDPTPNNVASSSSQQYAPSNDTPKSSQPRARRVPRSEMRALYRTLNAAELELRTRLAVDRFRDVVMEYIYATHKPNVPLPTTMQMRMHPPIARAAQDLDEVDYALKLALEAERRKNNPLPYLHKANGKPVVERKSRSAKQPVMVADPKNPEVMVKRKRGRPRKKPAPMPTQLPMMTQSQTQVTLK